MRDPGWQGVNFGAARLQRELAGQDLEHYVDRYNFMRELRSNARQEYLSIGASQDLERPAPRVTGGASIAGPSTSSASETASRRDTRATRASSLARRDDVNVGFWAPASPNEQQQEYTYAAAAKSPPKKSPGKSPAKKRAASFSMDEDEEFPSLPPYVEPSSPPYEPAPSQPMRMKRGRPARLLQKLPIFLLQLPVLVVYYHHMWNPVEPHIWKPMEPLNPKERRLDGHLRNL